MAPRLVRLLVPSPDRRRVLARPNGLAGWTLPVVALDEGRWTPEAVAAAGRVVGAPIRPVRAVDGGGWEVEALDRVPAAGTTWIAPAEAGRLGADATLLRRWADVGEG